MPDATNGDKRYVPPPVPEEEAKKPLTEAELRKIKFDKLKDEKHEDCSKRRAADLKAHLDVHFDTVNNVNETFAVPYGKPFEELTDDEKRNWNARRQAIDIANKEYHRAVRATYEGHVAEDRHLAKLRADAMKGAA